MLASHGGRAATRHAHNLLPHRTGGPPGTSRGIHIPSYVRLHPRIPAPGKAQKLFTQSRNLLAQFFNHLTTPGFRLPNVAPAARSLHGGTRSPSIQQGFSLPVRTALSRPLQPHFLPRPPAVPRTVAQVGLGTARSFSTSRPIFQNFVENIPVAGRAFYEADWEIKLRKERDLMKKPIKSQSKGKHASKEMLKPAPRHFSSKENMPTSMMEAQFDKYFAAHVVPAVTTCLLIPLAPTPTARVPLSENLPTDLPLLPLPDLASMHVSHETHSLRVSSLFSRLDAANVWARGVQCSAFSHGGGPAARGVCTMLKVEFVGWTKAEVRGVIGESGSGWCVLDEYRGPGQPLRSYPASEDDDTLSETSSLFSSVFDVAAATEERVDPAQSLHIPTLDFSASFQAPLSATSVNSPPLRATSTDFYPIAQGGSDFDPWLDSEVSSECGTEETGSWVHPLKGSGWFGVSSEFVEGTVHVR